MVFYNSAVKSGTASNVTTTYTSKTCKNGTGTVTTYRYPGDVARNYIAAALTEAGLNVVNDGVTTSTLTFNDYGGIKIQMYNSSASAVVMRVFMGNAVLSTWTGPSWNSSTSMKLKVRVVGEIGGTLAIGISSYAYSDNMCTYIIFSKAKNLLDGKDYFTVLIAGSSGASTDGYITSQPIAVPFNLDYSEISLLSGVTAGTSVQTGDMIFVSNNSAVTFDLVSQAVWDANAGKFPLYRLRSTNGFWEFYDLYAYPYGDGSTHEAVMDSGVLYEIDGGKYYRPHDWFIVKVA